MTRENLIEKYKKDISTIEECLNDIKRNIKLAEKEVESLQYRSNSRIAIQKQKDVIYDMEITRTRFLCKLSCYETFIKELESIKEQLGI